MKHAGSWVGFKGRYKNATCLDLADNLGTESYFKEAPDIMFYNVLLKHRPYIEYPWRDRQPLRYRCRREELPMSAES